MKAARRLHGRLIALGIQEDPYYMAKVLASYALSPSNLKDAFLVFNRIERPTLMNWNSMIRGLAQSTQPSEAITWYKSMFQLGILGNKLTYPFVLKACARTQKVTEGKATQSRIIKIGLISDIFVCNTLIHMYATTGHLTCARELLDEMSVKDLVSWKSLICGYSQNNKMREVLTLFEAMQLEHVVADGVTLIKVLLACRHLEKWETMHSVVKYMEINSVHRDVYLDNTLIDIYGQCGLVELARKVFDKMHIRNTVSWNVMIMGFAKSGDLVSAKRLFDNMPEKDVISWTIMVTSYCQAGRFHEALNIFLLMIQAKVKPDEITVSSVLSACAHLGALNIGKRVHCYIHENNVKVDIYVGNSLIDMYLKCGCIEMAVSTFNEMQEKDSVSWSSMITGLAVNGHGEVSLHFFAQMLKGGFRPSDVTFLGVLISCTHRGLLQDGINFFESMKQVYCIEPQMKHYGCIVDLLSRSGKLDHAYEFILRMPVNPDPIIWRTLLGACKVYGNVGLAEISAKKLLEIDPNNSGNYVLLSNTYASAYQWKNSTKMREMMTESHVYKEPGSSFIEACFS